RPGADEREGCDIFMRREIDCGQDERPQLVPPLLHRQKRSALRCPGIILRLRVSIFDERESGVLVGWLVHKPTPSISAPNPPAAHPAGSGAAAAGARGWWQADRRRPT